MSTGSGAPTHVAGDLVAHRADKFGQPIGQPSMSAKHVWRKTDRKAFAVVNICTPLR
jgi:hypothetical protein